MLLNCGFGEDSWQSLGLRGVQPVHPKGNQSWMFIGRTDAEVEAPILCPPHAKSWLIGKDPDAGKDWRQEEKGTTEDEMVGWHQWPMEMSLDELWELLMDRKAWLAAVQGSQRVGHDWATQLNWSQVIHFTFAIKKAEPWRTDAFKLWCWRRRLRVLGLQGDPTSPS